MGCGTSRDADSRGSGVEAQRAHVLFSPLSREEASDYVAFRLAADSVRNPDADESIRELCDRFYIDGVSCATKAAQARHEVNGFCADFVKKIKGDPKCAAPDAMQYIFDQPDEKGANDHLPPHVSRIPKAEQADTIEHIEKLFNSAIRTRMLIRLNGPSSTAASATSLKGLHVPMKPARAIEELSDIVDAKFSAWKNFFGDETKLPLPRVAEGAAWATDACFAAQRVAGVHPTALRCVREGPLGTSLRISSEVVQAVISHHCAVYGGIAEASLESLISKGRLFECDFSFLADIAIPAENCGCSPTALFYAPLRDGASSSTPPTLLPLAMRMYSDPLSPVFTPANCSPEAWLLCKTHFQVCDLFVMELRSHLLHTHLIPEAIYCRMRAAVPRDHPLAVLLAPHFRRTVAINWWARKDLVASGRAVPRLMVGGTTGMIDFLRRGLHAFSFEELNFPEMVRRRGLDLLEVFPFRDDALRLWDAVHVYVGDIVDLVYSGGDDAKVRSDDALQSWIASMSDTSQDGRETPHLIIKGMPNKVDSRNQLTEILTSIVFTVSVLHSGYQNAGYDFIGFVPNCPAKLKVPPPASFDCHVTLDDIVAAMPDASDSGDQVAVIRSLSMPPKVSLGSFFFDGDDGFLASLPLWWLVARRFQDTLERIAKAIDERCEKSPGESTLAYPYLNPRIVGMSVDL